MKEINLNFTSWFWSANKCDSGPYRFGPWVQSHRQAHNNILIYQSTLHRQPCRYSIWKRTPKHCDSFFLVKQPRNITEIWPHTTKYLCGKYSSTRLELCPMTCHSSSRERKTAEKCCLSWSQNMGQSSHLCILLVPALCKKANSWSAIQFSARK